MKSPFKTNSYVWRNKRTPKAYDGRQWTYDEASFLVRFMAHSGNYAMVRRKGCMPFVVSIEDLSLEPKYTPEKQEIDHQC